MEILKRIGARVAALRKAAGESQAELSVAVGVARSTIASIERGLDRGGVETMVAIADHYKVPMDWLLCRRTPSGGPLAGEFVDDMDELAWVSFWRGLSNEERRAVLRLLRVPNAMRAAV